VARRSRWRPHRLPHAQRQLRPPGQDLGDWSEPLTDPASARLSSPNDRYVQWKLELQDPHPPPPRLPPAVLAPASTPFRFSYQPQNNRPVVRQHHRHPAVGRRSAEAVRSRLNPAPVSAFSVTVTDSGDSGPATTSGIRPANQPRGVLQLFLSWQADDPDNDRLIYTLQVRGEGEREWNAEVRAHRQHLFFDADSLADGRSASRNGERPGLPILLRRPAKPTSKARLFCSTKPLRRSPWLSPVVARKAF